MNAPVFVDSNVFVYALDKSEKDKQRLAQNWRSTLWSTRLGRTSFQVLNEFYVNAVRLGPESRDDARAEIRDLLAWRPVPIDAELILSGWKTQDRYKIGHWDSLIVAAAERSSCAYLLSEDFQTGQKFGAVKVINPFQNEPESVLHSPI